MNFPRRTLSCASFYRAHRAVARAKSHIGLLLGLFLMLVPVSSVQATLAPPATQVYIPFIPRSTIAYSTTPTSSGVGYNVSGLFRHDLLNGTDYQITPKPHLDASWSPDDREYVAVNEVLRPLPGLVGYEVEESNIVRVELDSDTSTILHDCPEGCRGTTWSPSGELIAFSGSRQWRYLESDIYVMEADGSNLRQVSSEFYRAASPAWSPDSSRLAFSASDEVTEISVINIVTLDGEIVQTIGLENESLSSPTWSPDGERIAFIGYRDVHSLYVVDLETGEIETLTTSVEQGLGGIGESVWSPDGRYILLSSWTIPRFIHTSVYTLETGELRNVSGGGRGAWIP